MPRATRTLRRRVLANWAKVRGLLPAGVQDALFHLPVRAECATPALCARQGWTAIDLGRTTSESGDRRAVVAVRRRARTEVGIRILAWGGGNPGADRPIRVDARSDRDGRRA